MKKVYATPNATKVHVAKELLADNGIQAVVHGETFSIVLIGRIGQYALPSLWVNDSDEAAALALLKDFGTGEKFDGEEAESWTCPACGEIIGGQFGACWKCAAAGQAGPAPAGLPALTRARRGLLSSLIVAVCAGFIVALASSPMLIPGLAGILIARCQIIALILFIIGGVLSLHFLTEVFSAEEAHRPEAGAPEPRRGGEKLARVRRDVLLVLLLASCSPLLGVLAEKLHFSPEVSQALGLALLFYFLIRIIRAIRAK